jgi:hypothetical protein
MANEFKIKNGLSIGGVTSGTTILKSASAASGTLTLPATTDTLVGLATTDTLTNKTLTSPVISGGTINNAVIGGTTAAAGSFTTLTASSTITATGIVSGSELTSSNAIGDEGGQINLAKAPNGTIAGGVTIDVYQNKLRFFVQGGDTRGAYIDLSATSAGVATNLLTGGSGTTSNALTIGTGLSGTSFNGSSAVTIAIDSTVVTLTGSQTLSNKTLSSPVITGSLTAGGSTGTNGYYLQTTGSGIQWAAVASSGTSVFIANARSDLGYVYDATVTITEDLGTPIGTTTISYDLAVLKVDGIVSLDNLDSSVKSDYLAQAIIFGF